jgi:Na+/phosphate symporter
MIQRIQTIFLILTTAIFGALFKLPLAISDRPAAQFLSDKVFDVTDHIVLTLMAILGGLIALIAIFQFKNRKLQLKLVYGVIALAILLPLISFVLFAQEVERLDPAVVVYNQPGMYIPFGAILFGFFASYFIRKDEKIVRSMDRLR